MPRIFVLLGMMFCFSPFSVANTPLNFENFSHLPNISQVSLSPNGKKLVFLARLDDEKRKGTAVYIFDVATKKSFSPIYASNEKFLIGWVHWANDDQLLMSAVYPSSRYGIKTTETRLLKIDANTGEKESAYGSGFLRRLKFIPQFQDRIIDWLPDDDQHVLVDFAGSNGLQSKVLKLNLKKGTTKRVQGSSNHVRYWETDRQSRVRVSVKLRDKTYDVLVRKNPKSKKWTKMWTFDAFSSEQVWPMGFDHDPNVLYVRAYYQGKLAIFKMDLSQKSPNKELVFSDEHYDVDGSLIYSKKAQKVIGITYSQSSGFTFWEPSYKALQKGLDKALPKTDNTIVSFSRDEKRYILLATNDTDAGVYYLGDRNSNQLTVIAERFNGLPPELMSEKQSIEYQARDGLTIEGFLTLPKQSKGKKTHDKKLPTIIFPHGGPISYDGSGFDYWTQFFSSQGYAVLQMNFRGSSGYGYDFMKAGLKNWGQQMQLDVEDGTRWLIEQGIADPDKICMVGASYGGYASLMEAARNSDLYQCAVSFAGVTDLNYMMIKARQYINYKVAKEQIGSNRKQLKENSPVRLAEKINIPVLLVHGDQDRVVRVEHSRKMLKVLEKHNKDVIYIEQEGGNHFLSNEKHRVELFKEMQLFLKKYLH